MQRVMVFNRPIQAKRRSSNMKLLRLSHPKKVVAPVMPQRQRGAIRKMSEEEKAKRLADMMVDADLHESTRRTMQAKEDEYVEAKQKEDDAARKQEQEEGFVQAKFIRDINKKIYMENDTETLEDRLRRNRHYIERGTKD
eukprot:TRINITY_DN1280_c0_g1_i3.p1 TRINITY_DN1280_c0_g1~~TRINITY_DN1280_c0_g1_i3.p1  ORF type:complete len:140 (-),score=37.53 TRINITY_DN1280_c0_g1_i3:60-479(-)